VQKFIAYNSKQFFFDLVKRSFPLIYAGINIKIFKPKV